VFLRYGAGLRDELSLVDFHERVQGSCHASGADHRLEPSAFRQARRHAGAVFNMGGSAVVNCVSILEAVK
jgi:hypothetical protein